jgi:hypothetical protein
MEKVPDRPWHEPAPWRHRDAEHLLAEIDAIIVAYRKVVSDNTYADSRTAARADAVEKILALDFSLADAERWLDAAVRKGARRA